MKQPFWKILISYLFEWHLESVASDNNPDLHVVLKRGRYQLLTNNAIYSYADLYDNFVRSFRKINLSHLPGDNVLLLGFGLGSIPVILEKVFEKNFHYVGIEKDEAVLYLANKYQLPHLQSNIELICTDAIHFINQNQQLFDLICMDIFFDDVIPEQFEQKSYLLKLKSILHPQGLLMFNRLSLHEKDRLRTKRFFENVFKSVFPKGTYLDVKGNWMLLNTSNPYL